MNDNGDEKTAHTRNLCHDGEPAWSAGGSTIAFTAYTNNTNLDIYEPVGDGVPELRPALQAVHGGGFRRGDKAQPDFAALCNDFIEHRPAVRLNRPLSWWGAPRARS
jgi:hypothetical protein